jgi:hypothetical protein
MNWGAEKIRRSGAMAGPAPFRFTSSCRFVRARSWRSACAIALGASLIALHAYAEQPNLAVEMLKSKILEARNIQRVFADGLQHCAVLDGTSVYNSSQNRVILLSDLQASLQNLVKAQVFNAQKKHPWTAVDADERMKLAQSQADHDRSNCNLVAKMPEMIKELTKLESRQ